MRPRWNVVRSARPDYSPSSEELLERAIVIARMALHRSRSAFEVEHRRAALHRWVSEGGVADGPEPAKLAAIQAHGNGWITDAEMQRLFDANPHWRSL